MQVSLWAHLSLESILPVASVCHYVDADSSWRSRGKASSSRAWVFRPNHQRAKASLIGHQLGD